MKNPQTKILKGFSGGFGFVFTFVLVQYVEGKKLFTFPVITVQVNLGLGWVNS